MQFSAAGLKIGVFVVFVTHTRRQLINGKIGFAFHFAPQILIFISQILQNRWRPGISHGARWSSLDAPLYPQSLEIHPHAGCSVPATPRKC